MYFFDVRLGNFVSFVFYCNGDVFHFTAFIIIKRTDKTGINFKFSFAANSPTLLIFSCSFFFNINCQYTMSKIHKTYFISNVFLFNKNYFKFQCKIIFIFHHFNFSLPDKSQNKNVLRGMKAKLNDILKQNLFSFMLIS